MPLNGSSSSQQGRNEPLIGFNFQVSFAATPQTAQPGADSFFSRVSGIGGRREVELFREGGVNDRVYRLPKGMVYDNLILERGLLARDSELATWCFQNLTMPTSGVEPRAVVVSLLDYDSQTQTMVWAFYDCIPVRWSVSAFRADASILAIETLELSYARFEILQ